MTYENAAVSLFNPNEYYYYGPYEAPYNLGFGEIYVDKAKGDYWLFNIIDGKPTVLYFDNVCTQTDHLPGENGYSF